MQDIRSFFSIRKQKKKAEDDNSDFIPESPEVSTPKKKKNTRKRKQISDDSDDEVRSPPKIKKANTTPLKEVKATDIFGAAKIKRSEPIVKKPEPLVKKSKKNTEAGIHSDDEFEKSLLQIDEVDSCIQTKSHNEDNDTSEIEVKVDKPRRSPRKHNSRNNNNIENTSNKTNKTPVKRKLDKSPTKKSVSPNKDKNKTVKQDFSEFLVDEKNTDNDDKSDIPKRKKVKLHDSLNESVIADEEKHERKRHAAAMYQKYLNRTGPKHLGSKEIPEGLPNCLKDCAFLLTGVLDSFDRDEIVAAVTKYGGCVKNSISRKVTHILAGEDAGPAKLAKAQDMGIKIINEDEFLIMINGPNKSVKSPKKNKTEKDVETKNSSTTEPKKMDTHLDKNKKQTQKTDIKVKDNKNSKLSLVKNVQEKAMAPVTLLNNEKKLIINAQPNVRDSKKTSDTIDNTSLMWVDKYKPQSVKNIIGQHGDKSNAKKLTNWLTQWYVNRKAKIPKPSPWAKDDNGAYYKAALLSGPPGVGKTTTVSLVCKEMGFDMVEFNASDTRSKTLIREQIGELLGTKSLSAYANGTSGKGSVSKKHVLVMDEVDGMAGNEDRGGLQELISLIKSTSVPVICMCNDRSSEKMRSLLNYCYDLRFERPRANQIVCAMLSICYKEGVKITNDVLTQLVEAAGHDVRQTLHMLSVWVVDSNLTDHERLKKEADKVKKDMKMGPWEAIRKVFSAEEHRRMSINDQSDLFFTDYSIMPLFVHENYLNVVPHGPSKTASLSKLETLERLSRAADSISLGDLVDARIRTKQAWSLLPMQAMYSTVIPGHVLQGHIAGQIQFPGWLGKNSRTSKMRRLAQEIHAHTRLSTSGSKSSIFLDYAMHLRDSIINPLMGGKTDDVEKSLQVLEAYHLLREDLDSLVELSQWPEMRNPTVLIDPKIKAALTRTYNKMAPALPYAPGTVKKGRGIDTEIDNSQEEAVEVNEDSDPENDAMIKKKKTKETVKAGTSKASGKSKKNVSSSPNKTKKEKPKPNKG